MPVLVLVARTSPTRRMRSGAEEEKGHGAFGIEMGGVICGGKFADAAA